MPTEKTNVQGKELARLLADLKTFFFSYILEREF